MTLGNVARRLAFSVAGTALAATAHAHPGHGLPVGHSHGLFEVLVLVALVAISIWIARGGR